MKVLICGDRNWKDRETIRSWLSKLQDWGYTEVIEGEARGADTIAREEADRMGFTVDPYPANWGKYYRAAGPIRNREMLDQCPNLVLAFHSDISKSKGTANCIKEARKRGIEVKVITSGCKS